MRAATLVLMALGGCGGFGGTVIPGPVDTSDTSAPDDSGDSGPTGGDSGPADSGDSGPADSGDSGPGPVGTGDAPFITEVMDGGPSSKLRFVELYNPTTSRFEITNFRLQVIPEGDGNLTATTEFPSAAIASGKTFVICQNEAAFKDRFGSGCDLESNLLCGDGTPCGDGVDAYVLKKPTGNVLDWFGDNSESGEGTDWDYTSKTAKRNSNVGGPSSPRNGLVFEAGQWTLSSSDDAKPGSRD